MKRAKYISNGTLTYKIIGDQGPQGPKGDTGKSAYQIAVDNGYNGTESEWLATLKANIESYKLNEFNKNDITIGKFPNDSIGQSINTFVIKEKSFVCNQRWKVKKGDVIRWSWPWASFLVYDENGRLLEKLGTDGGKEGTIQSDNADTLVYYNANTSSVSYVDNFMFAINRELPTEYVEYGVIGIDTYNDRKTNDRIDEIKNDMDNLNAYRVNEFNKDDVTIGKYPNSALGQSINNFVVKENSFVGNQRWRVKKGDVIRWSWPWASFFIYNSDGILIETLGSNGEKEATIQSENAHTMVYLSTASISDNYITNFMFSINRELPIEYVPYGVIGMDTYNAEVEKVNKRIDEITHKNHKPYVLLTFDNGISSLDDNVVRLLEKYGFKGSFVGSANPSVSLELLKRGWDIGTYDNSPDILPPESTINSESESDIAAYDNYVYQAQKKQSDIGIFNPTVWCSRQNKWGTALEHGAKRYGYKMARAYQTGDVYNLNINIDFPVFDSQMFYSTDLETVKSVIDTACNKPNSIVIILAHKLVNSAEDDRGYDCLATEYEKMLVLLKEKVDNGLVETLTYRELYKDLYQDDAYENDYNRLFKMANFSY